MRAIVEGIEHFLTQWGAKVQCDLCGDEYGVGRRWKSAADRTVLADQLREQGWTVVGDHERHTCPTCNLT